MARRSPKLTDDAIAATDAAPADPVRIGRGIASMLTRAAPEKESGNEDAAALIPYGPGAGVLVVADGLGGLPAASAASGALIRTLISTVKKAYANERPIRAAVLDALEAANKKILSDGLGNATTVAAAEIDGDTVRTYHVGDSQILMTGQRGRIKLQTIPHSPTGYAIEAGTLDEDDALTHDERHFVANVVGADDMSIAMGTATRLSTFDTLILASDGLWDNLYVEEVIDEIRKGDLADAADSLMRVAQERIANPQKDLPSHADDVTLVLYRLDRKS